MQVGLGQVCITPRQKELVNQALDNNRLSSGPMIHRFEELTAQLYGTKHAIFLASGTCALQIILEALKELRGWDDDCEVIVPATTFIASVAAVRHAGLVPVLGDVDPLTGNLEPIEIIRQQSSRTVAVMTVHLLGRAANMTRIVDYAGNLDIIEDCCEAAGVEHDGKRVGSIGIAGAASSYVCHHVSTGIGGAIVTNNDQLVTICRSLMVHGRDPSYLSMDDDDGLDDAQLTAMMRTRYSFVRWGHSFRASEMEAALGVGAMEDDVLFTADQESRRIVAFEIGEALKPWADRIAPQEWPKGSNPLFYPLVCDSEETCRGLSEAYERAGIETRPLMPLLTQPTILDMLARQSRTVREYPNALKLCRTAFLVGCHSGIQAAEIENIRKVTEDFFSKRSAT